MSSRRSSSNSVSLFPFLAVLVCAMGALIFLLLVTTRRVRELAVQRAQQQLMETEPTPVPIAPPADEPDSPTAAETAQQELLAEWQLRVAALQEQHAHQQQRLEERREQLAETEHQLAELRTSLSDLDRRQRQLGREQNQTAALGAALVAERKSLQERITHAQQRRRQIETQQQVAQSRYMILPFDPQLGTTRRPILIECTATELRFLPEDIAVRPSDLEGFTARVNPLLAGTEALMGYWNALNEQQPESQRGPEPYVLLLVRPSGTVAFYVAQEMLSRLRQPFGYELVEESTEFALPEADPAAAETCRTAIARLLAERQSIVEQVRSARGTIIAERPHLRAADDRFDLKTLGPERRPSGSGRTWERPQAFEGQEHRESASLEIPSAAPGQGREAASRSGAIGTSEPTGAAPGIRENTAAELAPKSDPIRGALTEPATPSDTLSEAPSPTNPTPDDAPFPSFGELPERRQSRGDLDDRMKHHRWGLRDPRATIGLERQLTIHAFADRLIVADALRVPAGQGETRQQLLEAVAAAIDHQARDWGRPPDGFYWIPSVKFIVHPGGYQHYERLHGSLGRWGIASKVEYSLESASSH